MMRVNNTSVLVLWLLVLAGCGARSKPAAGTPSSSTRAPETTVVLVRHAERASQAANSDLAPAGLTRAELLTGIAREARVSGVLTTDFCRTAQTGQAAALGVGASIDVMQTGNANAGLDRCTPPITARVTLVPAPTAADIANHIRREYAGRAALVVGHSNTIPQIAAALGAPLCPQFLSAGADGQCLIPEPDYRNLFIVRIRADGTVTVEHRRYG